jgi:formyl-CoA transferase
MAPDGLVEPIDAKITHGVFGVGMGPDVVALHAAYHIAGALLRRDRTGLGACIDVSGADAIVASGWRCLSQYLNDDRIVDRFGTIPENERSDAAKYQVYETADKKIVLFCAIEPKFWRSFCQLVGRADLSDRGSSTTPVDFAFGDLQLRQELQAIFHTRDLAWWMELAAEHGLPIGPNYSSATELLGDEHFRVRGIFVDAEHPVAGPFTYVGRPSILRDEPSYRVRRPAPMMGEHSSEILDELGYTPEQILAFGPHGIV